MRVSTIQMSQIKPELREMPADITSFKEKAWQKLSLETIIDDFGLTSQIVFIPTRKEVILNSDSFEHYLQ